jgi:adenine phosphoribosyltransferase
MDLKEYIASIPDYPIKGVLFRDITPLIGDGAALHYACEQIAEFARSVGAEVIVGPESRGFIFGTAVAYQLGVGFVPARKPDKLPRETISYEYALEYGTARLEMHKDAIRPGQKVVVIDDLLATGGTVMAANRLVEQLGGVVVGDAFVIELTDLNGRQALSDYTVKTLIQY